MKALWIVAIAALLSTTVFAKPTKKFARDQANASRVKAARAKWTDHLKTRFKAVGLKYPARAVFLRAFKDDDVLEVWAADKTRRPLHPRREHPHLRALRLARPQASAR